MQHNSLFFISVIYETIYILNLKYYFSSPHTVLFIVTSCNLTEILLLLLTLLQFFYFLFFTMHNSFSKILKNFNNKSES